MAGMSSRVWMAAVVALGVLVTCASPAEDGELCESSAQCASGRCIALTCEGSDCKCEGADCRGRSSCREGWLCTRGKASSVVEGMPQCRPQCTEPGSCAPGMQCNNGVCQAGAEPFALTWVSIPRTSPCSSRVACAYEVRAPAEVSVETYTWSFGDAPPIETKEPMTSFTYGKPGAYSVTVRARASTGAVAELRTTEVLCAGALNAACDPSGSPCCEGSCSVQGACL